MERTSFSRNLNELWDYGTADQWNEAVDNYVYVDSAHRNIKLERDMNNSITLLSRFEKMNAELLYDFILDEFIVWKYTAPNRKATTVKYYKKKHAKSKQSLIPIRDNIINIYKCCPDDTRNLLKEAMKIGGIGVAGGSGLLSLLFPSKYGTVDYFIVERLKEIKSYPEIIQKNIKKINSKNISIRATEFLENLYREKADSLNKKFETSEWTPRKIDMVLWSYGRAKCKKTLL